MVVTRCSAVPAVELVGVWRTARMSSLLAAPVVVSVEAPARPWGLAPLTL